MISNRFFNNLMIRVLLIVLSSIGLAYVTIYYQDYLLLANLFIVIGIQTWLLARFVNKTNYDLANFFLSVRFDDTSLKFHKKKYGKSFDAIYENLEELNEKFRLLRISEEKQFRFLKAVTDHVKIGIIAFDEAGQVELSNTATLDLFNLTYIKHLDQLNRILPGLKNDLLNASRTTRNVITVEIEGTIKKILVRANEYKVSQKSLKIVSFQDIVTELDEKEVDSWQKLIRILSHEIMNSVSPIKSSIVTIEHLLVDKNSSTPLSAHLLNEEIIGDVVRGVEIVKERSIGMSEFVEHFRSFTLLPKPEFQKINIQELFKSIEYLFRSQFENEGIKFASTVENKKDLLYADSNMVEQMIINMIHNSIQSKAISIELRAMSNDESMNIEITDDGIGIEPDNIDKIFIPFFTTKSTGTGVGLSLARQIMRYHHGNITVRSQPGIETTFTISF